MDATVGSSVRLSVGAAVAALGARAAVRGSSKALRRAEKRRRWRWGGLALGQVGEFRMRKYINLMVTVGESQSI